MYVMPAEKAAELYRLLEEAWITVWIDGGWAVDALLGEQTREHEDLDIVLLNSELSTALMFFASLGIRAVGEDHALPWNFLLRDSGSVQVDVHVIWFTIDATPMYGPPESQVIYPDLSGRGVIAGVSVNCTTPASIVEHRTGFHLRQRDHHDVRLLCDRFGIELPEEYRDPQRQ